MNNPYLIESERLGFRNWLKSDLKAIAAINADPKVMEFFPKTLSTEESASFLKRFQDHYTKHGYTYFAVELLSTGELIGFIGLAFQEYEAPFNPATDIGWRLKPSAWGQGYATEGAKRCLELAFSKWGLKEVISVCTVNNRSSEKVMQKLGMEKQGGFKHPALKDYPHLEDCIWYKILTPS